MAGQQEIPTNPDQPVESQQVEQPPLFYRRWPRIALFSAMGLFGAVLLISCIFYAKCERMIDARLKHGAFADSVNIYTSPRTVAVGDAMTAEEMVAELRRSGYSTSRSNPVGWYNLSSGGPSGKMEIFPGRDSFPGSEPAGLGFDHGKVARIVSLQDNTSRQQIAVEPRLIATLSEGHEKRQIAQF